VAAAETIPNPATVPVPVAVAVAEAAEVMATTDAVTPTTAVEEATAMIDAVAMVEEAVTVAATAAVTVAATAKVAVVVAANLVATRAGAMLTPEVAPAEATAEEAVTTDVEAALAKTNVDSTATLSPTPVWNEPSLEVTTNKPPESTLTTTTKSLSKFPERTLPIPSTFTPWRLLVRIFTATLSSVVTPAPLRSRSILVPLVPLGVI